MDAADLRIFEAVARLGGMKRAASELNTVQSNVTARIRLLEAELGVPLFRRHSRGVTPTPAARALQPYAVRIERLLEEARHAVIEDGKLRGLLTVGSLESTAAVRLSPILMTYGEANPEVDLALRTGTTCELIEDVLEHRLEGAFVCGPVGHPDLEEELMFSEELVVVTPRGVRSLDELTRRTNLKIVVLRAGCSYRQRLEAVFAKRRINGLRRLEFGTIDGIIACVSGGFGVTLLPRSIVAPALRAGRLAIHELPKSEAAAETVFIRRRDNIASRALLALIAAARPAQAQIAAAE
jgi:LysR family transcriptional regulator, cell division regulator